MLWANGLPNLLSEGYVKLLDEKLQISRMLICNFHNHFLHFKHNKSCIWIFRGQNEQMFYETEEFLRRMLNSLRLQLDEIPVTLKTQSFLRSLKIQDRFSLTLTGISIVQRVKNKIPFHPHSPIYKTTTPLNIYILVKLLSVWHSSLLYVCKNGRKKQQVRVALLLTVTSKWSIWNWTQS